MKFDEDADEEASEQDAAEGQNTKDTDDDLQPDISLVVTIDKGAGLTLEFSCNLDADDLEIESMTMKTPEVCDVELAEDFPNLDADLQRDICKYLGARGIKVSLYEFLREYMMSKDAREYIVWLKYLKEFVEK